MLAHQPADATTEADAADAGVAHDASGGGQAVGLGFVIDVAPQGTALDTRRAFGGIDPDPAHFREIDDDPVVAHRGAGHVVTSAPYRDLEVATACETDRRGHVGCPGAAGDQSGSPVDHAVPHDSGVVVVRVIGGNQFAPEIGDPVVSDRATRPAHSFSGWCCHRLLL